MEKPFLFQKDGTEVTFDGAALILQHAGFIRKWILKNGWCTVLTGSKESGAEQIKNPAPDWKITACEGAAELVSVECQEHAERKSVLITSLFHYPESQLYLKHEITCFPGVPGMRIQVSLKSEVEIPAFERSPERGALPQFVDGYSESLPLGDSFAGYHGFGFNNDSQHRYSLETPILTECSGYVNESDGLVSVGNCNGIFLYRADGSGFVLVKESHKCANSSGVSTGEFIFRKNQIHSTGLGFSDGSPHWLSGEGFHSAWANWCVPFRSGMNEAVRNLKQFDRARYPFEKERDMFIAMNTWGSRGDAYFSRMAATEENVLAELESCADLGIDLLQIDDGWQFKPGTADFQNCAWVPSPEGFPHGWSAVKQRAKELGMKLGLWAPPDFITAEQLIENIREGGFRRIKLDFLNLTKRNLLDQLLEFAQKIISSSPEPVGINWDITEKSPRMGFYFGREYGNIFLQNCENSPPGMTSKRFIAYDPEVTLNQTWLLAKYFNLNQVQITIQRIAESPHGKGYPQDYACGIALMGNPLFFLESRRFSEEERALVKNVLTVYKKYREKILNGYVSPIGRQPDGTVWTGFQCTCSHDYGFLTLFREKDSEEPSARIRLDVPAGSTIRLQGLYQGKDQILKPEPDGTYLFSDLERAAWAFYRYEVTE